ncbi:MAG TPA: GNAT family N-acetyltransferase [Candidatus Limnocylindrales bacterium]
MVTSSMIGPETVRELIVHEARVHAMPGREIRQLDDATVLYDPRDAEPFWNRLVGLRWPSDGRAFDRRLDEVITLFATLGRVPHVWPLPLANEPPDLIGRLVGTGFESISETVVMVLVNPSVARNSSVASPGDDQNITVDRFQGLTAASVRASPALAEVLVDAFDVGIERLGATEAETLAALDEQGVDITLVTLDGEPAAVAKRTTLDGMSYISSIGTRRRFRGRGLGRLVTALVSRDAFEFGSRWTYLAVHAENHVARRVYERVGYVAIGAPVPHLLLRG